MSSEMTFFDDVWMRDCWPMPNESSNEFPREILSPDGNMVQMKVCNENMLSKVAASVFPRIC